MKILTYERMTRIEKIFWYSFCFVSVAFVVLLLGGMMIIGLYNVWIEDRDIVYMCAVVFFIAIMFTVILDLWEHKKKQLLREKEEPKETENEE